MLQAGSDAAQQTDWRRNLRSMRAYRLAFETALCADHARPRAIDKNINKIT
jgi:hypothetical protein